MALTDTQPATRKQEIYNRYLQLLDAHIAELKRGMAEDTLKIEDFAQALFIHPRHLSNTIHELTGDSPCSMYEERLMKISRELILETDDSIASVARHLMYDPSNFSKFFKS
ncbi:MAG: helix-turn-helix domain-containing protein, partial [Chitinophagaceae bacterium]|nr:helix-turn-helix domain-containing protein [Chitinophagaceae bacterium]